MTSPKPINIAILAMGGEGGGVLTDWLLYIGEQAGYLAQKTSVPGVAQRTGATIYYVELFPKNTDAKGDRPPVLGLMPMPGDIDLLVASELMEAGRAVQRGLVTPDRTNLIASTHRVYSMTEKTAVADGRVDANAIIAACKTAAMSFFGFDMQRLAEDNHSVISAVLLGAVAASNALPFSREDYERAIRAGGKGTESSLAAFSAGYAAAAGAAPKELVTEAPEVAPIIAVRDELAGEARRIVLAGIDRTADYQDRRYAQDYYDRLQPVIDLANGHGEIGQTLICETARQLALGMTYEDTIRVAELKIRGSRFQRVLQEVSAAPGQIVQIVEFMHPRVEEIADTMPAPIGRWILRNKAARAVLARFTAHGRKIHTTSLSGFLLLYALASMKPMRRSTLRFAREQAFLKEWLNAVEETASRDITVAVEIAQLRNLVKGYGETHERGLMKYRTIRSFVSKGPVGRDDAATIRRLVEAAQKTEDTTALEAEIEKLAHFGKAACASG